MSAQTTYGYKTQIGAAGGIVDLAPYVIDTFVNEENTGVMKFGVAVAVGTNAGSGVKMPTADATICGITVNGRTTEYDVEGNLHLRKGASVGVMQFGRVYARVKTGVTPAYGDHVYVVTSGTEVGYVSNESTDGVEINAQFLGGVDSTAQVAIVELFSGRIITTDLEVSTNET